MCYLFISGHSLCEKEWLEKVEPVMGGLGSRPAHLAPLLAWCVLQLRSPHPPAPHVYHKLANRALTGNVFGYLQEALDCPAIKVSLISDASLPLCSL